MTMSINRFAWHNFRIPRFGKPKSDLANWGSNRARAARACICCVPKYTRVGCTGPGRHLHVRAHSRYTRYRFTCGRTCFAVNRLRFVFPVLRERLHTDNMLECCCARALAQRVAYWSSHVAGAWLHTRIRVTRVTHYIRDSMITGHDHQLVEIVRGGFADTHLRFGKDYKWGKPILGIHAAGQPASTTQTRECTCLFRCWRITLNSVQAVVGDPHDHVDNRLHGTTLWSQIWRVQFDIGIWISSDSPSGSTYLGYSRYAQHVVVS